MKYRYREPHEMKDSGVEWLGMIPKEWEISKIKYKVETLNGFSFKSDNYIDEGIPIIRIGDINDKIDLTKTPKIEYNENLSQYIINKEDILVALTGATIGKTGIYDSHIISYLNQRVGLFRGKTIYNKLLFYIMKSNMMKKFIELECSGSAQENIGNNDIGKFKIPNFEYKEQKTIADFLDQKTAEFDSVIEKKEKLIEKLEEAKKSLISEVVTGKKEVLEIDGKLSVRNKEIYEMKDSNNIFFPMQPLTWKIVKFKYITNKIIDGAHFTPTYIDEGIPFLRVTDITKNKESKIELKNVKYIPKKEHLELIKRCNPQKGDLLVSKNGTIGVPKVIDWNWEFSIFVSLCLIKVKTKINPYFISYYFKGNVFNTQIAFSGKKTSIMNLHLDKIREFELIIPSKNIQDNIIKFLDQKTVEFDSIIQKNKDQIKKIKEAKQSLISEAVTGKIEVID